MTADKVSIDLSGTIGENSLKGIQADTIVYKGSTQKPLDATSGTAGEISLIAKQDLNSKDFTATVNASGLNDTLKVTVAAKVPTVGKDLKTVTVSGDMGEGLQDKYEFSGTNAAELTKIDFSGLRNVESGTITTVAANTKIVSIKGTAGNDTIDTSATPFDAANVTIETGEGTNKVTTGTVTATKQVITIKGGSGNDTFDVSASKIAGSGFDGSSDNLRYSVIENVNVGDKIKIAGTTVADIQKVNLNPNGNAYANFAQFAKETGLFSTATANNKVYAFSYQNDTYLFYNQGAAGATGFELNENIVKLSGVNTANLNASLGTDGEITINGL